MTMMCAELSVAASPRNAEPYRENHAYVPYDWCSGDVSVATIEQRLDQLERFGIRYLLCDIGCYTPSANGTVRNTIAYRSLGRWIEGGHRHGMTVLACINYVMRNSDVTKTGTNAPIHQYVHDDIVRISRIFTQTGVDCDGKTVTADGVQMDVEPFRREYQDSFLQLMKDVRSTVGNAKYMGIATPAKNGIWSDAYATEIINLFDFVFPMVYDSNGPESWGNLSDGVTRTQEEYIQLTVNTCVWYAGLIARSRNPRCILSITTPVYADCKDESGVYYHKNYDAARGETLEKLENCLLGVRRAVAQGVKVDGAGVFYWPAFIGESGGYQPTVNLHYNYALDQAAWNTLWLSMQPKPTTRTTTKTTKKTAKPTTRTTTKTATKTVKPVARTTKPIKTTTKTTKKTAKPTTRTTAKTATKTVKPVVRTTKPIKKTTKPATNSTRRTPQTTATTPTATIPTTTPTATTATTTTTTTTTATTMTPSEPLSSAAVHSTTAVPPSATATTASTKQTARGTNDKAKKWATAIGVAVAIGAGALVSVFAKRRK